MPPRGRHGARQGCRRRAGLPEVHAEEGRRAGAEGSGIGHCQRREQSRRRHRRAQGASHRDRCGAGAQALRSARQGPWQPHRQAQQPHHHSGQRRQEGLTMGQKVNPLGIRLGITRDWTSKWYASKKQFPQHVYTDFRVRGFLRSRLSEASVSRIHIERAAKKVNITIQTARPGIVIGKKGEDIEKLRLETAALLRMPMNDVRLNIAEIRKPELDAQLVGDSIAQQIEKRVMFRRAMKRAVMSTMRSGALGVKVRVSGRLNGSEIARTEWYREGRIPLHTFRADIDYGLSDAHPQYGIIGVKVWIFKGEVFDKVELAQPVEAEAAAEPARRGAGAPAPP